MEKKWLIILLLTLGLFFPDAIFAETVILKSGKQVVGVISENTDDFIKIQTTDGKDLYYYKNTIRIIKDDAGKIIFPKDYEQKEMLRKRQESIRQFRVRLFNAVTRLRKGEEYIKSGDYVRGYREYINSGLLEITVIFSFLWIIILSGIITGCILLICHLFFKKWRDKTEPSRFKAKDLYAMLVFIFALPWIISLVILGLNYYFADYLNNAVIDPLVISVLLSNLFLVLVCLGFLKSKYKLDNASLGFVSYGYKLNILLPLTLTVAGILVSFLFFLFLNLSGIEPPTHPFEPLTQNIFSDGNITSVLLFFFLGVVSVPITEEIIFRVFLLNFFRRYTSLLFAVIFSASLFAIIHLSIINAPYYLLIGIILAITYIKTKTIIPCIVTHGLFNSLFLLTRLLTYGIQ